MTSNQTVSKKLMPYAEVLKLFSEGRRMQLAKQGPMRVCKVNDLQRTMKLKRRG